MGRVTVGATVSLDRYVAGPDETGFEHLFAWFARGDVEFPRANPGVAPSIRLAEPDHRSMREVVDRIGVFVIGRRMFDLTDGWGGRHPSNRGDVGVVLTDAPNEAASSSSSRLSGCRMHRWDSRWHS